MNISNSLIKFASHDHIKEKVVKLIKETNYKIIDMQNIFMGIVESHLENRKNKVPKNFKFTINEFALFCRMIHNYCKFFKFMF